MLTSPQVSYSPLMGGPRYDGAESGPQHLSKRDKRRTQLQDRYDSLVETFGHKKGPHFVTQLQALRMDVNMILEAQVHSGVAVPNTGDEIAGLVRAFPQIDEDSVSQVLKGDISSLAGREYSKFSCGTLNSMEIRDYDATQNLNEFEKRLADLQNSNTFLLKVSDEEHTALASTLRDRLINSVVGRKNRLLREKESLDIGDSNAFLLHPSQYTLTNPASPGGGHSKRTSRLRRDMEEMPGFESAKRKRKAADEGSPAPHPSQRRLMNKTATGPIWSSENILASSSEDPKALYTIDRLFTDRELSMNYNNSALTAHEHLINRKYGQHDASESADSDSDCLAGGAAMDRNLGLTTRSTRGTGLPNLTAGGVEIVRDMDSPANLLRIMSQIPRMPPPITQTVAKPYVKEQANSPPGVVLGDGERDLARMQRAIEVDARKGVIGCNLLAGGSDAKLLRIACKRREPDGNDRKQAVPNYLMAPLSVEDVERAEAIALEKMSAKVAADAPPTVAVPKRAGLLGGEEMSRAPSGVDSEIGGVAMDRVANSSMGGGSTVGRRGRRRLV